MPRPQFTIKTLLWLMAVAAALFRADSTADDTSDRKQMEGKWRVVDLIADGEKPDDEFKKVDLSVTFDASGKWMLTLDGERVASGTSVIDATTNPRSMDFKSGDGTIYLGIYEFTDKVRQICFAPPDHSGPTEFSSTPKNYHVLMGFERKKAD
jgi:uncharacterized protein (TIGR03067 family)